MKTFVSHMAKNSVEFCPYLEGLWKVGLTCKGLSYLLGENSSFLGTHDAEADTFSQINSENQKPQGTGQISSQFYEKRDTVEEFSF